jgi:hypothetical protein
MAIHQLASRSTTAPRAARSHRGAETDHEILQAPLKNACQKQKQKQWGNASFEH